MAEKIISLLIFFFLSLSLSLMFSFFYLWPEVGSSVDLSVFSGLLRKCSRTHNCCLNDGFKTDDEVQICLNVCAQTFPTFRCHWV